MKVGLRKGDFHTRSKMKLAIAQIATYPGYIERNTEKIISYIGKAREEGANLIVFPELAIPGYMSMDLMLQKGFVQRNLEALEEIVESTEGISAIVGYISQDRSRKKGPDGTARRYNSAAVISDGKVVGVQSKTLLPDYDVFFENRYFSSAGAREPIQLNGAKIGIEICEDLWDEDYPIKVTDELAGKGADLIVNISGSPFYIGKRKIREDLIRKKIRNIGVPFVYTNLVGGQDGYEGELIFDGQSMVFNERGDLIGEGKAFEEDLLVVDLTGSRKIHGREESDISDLHKALTLGIRDYFSRAGVKRAFIGLSGGIDSAVVAALATGALGKENVTGVTMPSRYSSEGSVKDSEELARALGITFLNIPIEKARVTLEDALSKEFLGMPKDVTEENIQARLRGIYLMALSNKFGGMVISTGNKTEMALGYMTLYGDMCGGLAAIGDVNKMRVYDLTKHINSISDNAIISKNILFKEPSAELREGQTDVQGLGASYGLLSPLVDWIVEEGATIKELVKGGFEREYVNKVMDLIKKKEFKRRQAPPLIKVTNKAFGIGRRIPMNHGFTI